MTEMLVVGCLGNKLEDICFRLETEGAEPIRGLNSLMNRYHFSIPPFDSIELASWVL